MARRTHLVVVFLMALSACFALESAACDGGDSSAYSPAKTTARPAAVTEPVHNVEVVILSRGRGVPARAKAVYKQIRELVRAETQHDPAATQREEVIGLEGERRLCIWLANPARGARLCEQIRTLGITTDLVTVKVNGCRENPTREKLPTSGR